MIYKNLIKLHMSYTLFGSKALVLPINIIMLTYYNNSWLILQLISNFNLTFKTIQKSFLNN